MLLHAWQKIIYLSIMATRLQPDTEFIVKEEVVLVYILTGLFVLIFIYGILDLTVFHGVKDNTSAFSFLFAIIPAIYFFRKGYQNPIALRISRVGIYEGNQLVTDWDNLIRVYVTQKEWTWRSLQDNFLLVVEFYGEQVGEGRRRKIPLTNTQNKSEEEVMYAIRFFKEFHESFGRQP